MRPLAAPSPGRSRRRARLARLPRRAYWPIATGLALVAGTLTAGAVARIGDAAQAYGTRRAVIVATRPLAPGHTITADDIAPRVWPAVAVPVSAVTDDVVGRVVVASVVPGEALVAERLAGSGADGPAALVPVDHRGLVIPIDPVPDGIRVGDRVDLLSVDRVLTRDATVIAVGDASMTVAVDHDDVGRVAAAVLDGAVLPALVGPG